ncbi:mechanosensitive ion channel family protein [Entomomonas asaccharolytica]|uniref:Mechanosensitive ion channel family protein n=1 Tax=Entomomonas asaccharolytica TaxID=2785331 RepID=A0A974RVQ9_9GAMM|nr:mechanosensitive ion channel family protein [Entomomonas asaccharolytica]QQP84322.1 mechanosensitive ion channel family protein [Entomomonas asaccharolytica]
MLRSLSYQNFSRTVFLLLMLLFFCGFAATSYAALPNPLKSSSSSESQSTVTNAEMAQSLEALIKTLEDNKQRQQLVIDLKELRDSLQAAAKKDEDEKVKGLLAGISGLVDSLSHGLDGETPVSYWKERSKLAFLEFQILTPPIEELSPLFYGFSFIIILWFVIAQIMLWLIKRINIRYKLPLTLSNNPNTWELLLYAVEKLLPWVVAFFITLYSSQMLPETAPLGKSVALLMTYSILGGGVFAALCFISLSLLSGDHRWGALRILRKRAFKPLFSIGLFASLGDALTNYQVIGLLGGNLSLVLSTLNNLLAALLTGWFVITFRRPIAHLIRNRSLNYRKKRKSSYDFLRFLSMVWHIPILMLVLASLVATIFSGDPTSALRKALLCTALLIVALVLTGLIQRHATKLQQRSKRTQNALYLLRLIRFGYTLLNFAVWIIFIDFALRVWDSSILQFEQGAGHDLTVIIITIVLTILITRLVWILVDTAIYRALTGVGRNGPSTRALTMMPLIRNTALCIILVIATIVALANLGMNVTPLLAGAGVIGLAIGFGAQSLVSDLITGLFIIVEDSLAIGDYVDVGNHKGTVEAITIRTVCLRDIDGIVHIVPFSEIKTVKNYSRELGFAIFRISIAHDMNIDEAIKAVRSVANEMRLDPILQRDIWSPIEIQGVESFDSGNAVLRARFKTAPLKQFEISRIFNLRLKRYLDEHGLDLGVPRRSIRIFNETSEAQPPIPSE